MNVLEQDEVYDEQDVSDEEYDDIDESDAETTAGYDSFWGIPKQKFFIIVAVIVMLLIGVVVILIGRNKKSSDEEVFPEEYTEQSGDTVDAVTTAVYDENGNQLGTADTTAEGGVISDLDFNPIGFIGVDGTVPFYDESGNSLGMYTPVSDDSSSQTDVDVSTASDYDTVTLRKLGYTGDEIELAMSTGADFDSLVEEAEKLRDEEAKAALKRMSKSASKEFKYIVKNSIFSMPEYKFEEIDESGDFVRYDANYVVNADFEKVPTYGNQLFIKAKIANDTYTFVLMTPDRWQTLPDSGNIVLRINYTVQGVTNPVMYITSIEEVDTTKITVNPEDSASDINDILEESSSHFLDYIEGDETTGNEDNEDLEMW